MIMKVDEDDNGELRLERVNRLRTTILVISGVRGNGTISISTNQSFTCMLPICFTSFGSIFV